MLGGVGGLCFGALGYVALPTAKTAVVATKHGNGGNGNWENGNGGTGKDGTRNGDSTNRGHGRLVIQRFCLR